MILTVDFGTTATKVAVWGDDGLVVVTRAEIPTSRPELGWAEQEPFGWWTSVVVACADARARAPEAFGAVAVVGCSGARQSFVPVTSAAEPLGRGLLWSDRRAAAEAAALAATLGGEAAVRGRTGVPLDAGSVAAKVAWLAAHEPGRLSASDWLLSPRDLVVWRLTGEVATDATMASRLGLYDLSGELVSVLAGPAAERLPPVLQPGSIVGALRAVPAAELGLRAGIPVVLAAGDRPCEVVGAGSSGTCPMVAWGTTANVSVAVSTLPDPVPEGAVLSRAALGGYLLEGGLSAAGSFLAWLGRLLDAGSESLAAVAASSPIGARGVTAVPWLDGARAPWWRDGARAAFTGLSAAHDRSDVARAVFEAVAFDVARCLEVVSAPAGQPESLTLGGSGTGIDLWVSVLTGVTGLSATRRRSGEAASAGAAVLAARAVSMLGLTPASDRPAVRAALDALDPVSAEFPSDPASVVAYASLRPLADRVAATLIDLPAAQGSRAAPAPPPASGWVPAAGQGPAPG